MPAEPERLTYVLTIDCDHLGERTANAAYILTLKVSYDCRPAPQHVMSWHLGQIRRGAVHVAGVPTMVAHGPADHAYEVAASAEDPASRVGRSRPIASFGLFHGVLLCAKGLIPEIKCTSARAKNMQKTRHASSVTGRGRRAGRQGGACAAVCRVGARERARRDAQAMRG